MSKLFTAVVIAIGIITSEVPSASAETERTEEIARWKKIGPYYSYSAAKAKARALQRAGYRAYVSGRNHRYYVNYE